MSLATYFDRFGWNCQGLLAMVNLGFLFFIFLKKNVLLIYLSFKNFQSFCRIYTAFLFSNGFSYFFYCCLALVLMNPNLLKFLKYLYLFKSYAKIMFLYFSKIILNLTKEKIFQVFGTSHFAKCVLFKID